VDAGRIELQTSALRTRPVSLPETLAIIFDANVATNAKVKAARRALAAELTKRGALVRFGALPTDNSAINGPDDLIAVSGDAALWRVLDRATADKPAQKARADRPQQGRVVQLQDPDPWPESVDGAALLTMIESTFTRFAILPPGAAVALTLWTAHTYAIETTWISPLAAVTSPVAGRILDGCRRA
jgi:hypothetical protein